MPLSNRLCNPTPFKVVINWNRPVRIVISPDNYVDLSVQQMDDFRPGKPGSENVRNLMHFKGVFLYDSDIDYDIQSLSCLKKCFELKSSFLKERISTLVRERTSQGLSDSKENLVELKKQLGLDHIEDQLVQLERRIKFFEEVVSKKSVKRGLDQFDPERTLFLVEGKPREFPSRASKELFKLEHPDLVAGDPAEKEDDNE